MNDVMIAVNAVRKTFMIPRVRRQTVREHVFDRFRPRAVEQLTVLRDMTFTIRRGESVGLMGRNGSGKSTLLKIISGVYRPDAGTVHIGGGITPVLELGVGFNGELDAVDNVYLLGTVMGMSLRQVERSIDGILEFAGLERFARLKLQHFSSGMAARLAYAVALSSVQEIVILDEILAVGDAAFKAKCQDRYKSLVAAGHTVVLVSHDPVLVSSLCSRALLIEQGAVASAGAARVVAQDYLRLLEEPTAAAG